ncbi:UNVERIFIED_CONTAM: hypothetical protein Scaly_0834500 [Sesamum calycinum]|uniref:Uncharacterized protein n=1 Tax=Sesamum calycinum TaxID=2727403 RepID=A0AAW2RAV6_9LAMI
MLYWKDRVDLKYCMFCGNARYKLMREQDPHCKKSPYAVLRYMLLTSHLQRLYVSRETSERMSWHATHQTKESSMCHSFDVEVGGWKHFDRTYPNFIEEPCNIQLGLCTDSFAPHEQYSHTYSCWPVIITPYNLPMCMCMNSEYMFLSMVIPNPSNPKNLICVLGIIDRRAIGVTACWSSNVLQCHGQGIHYAGAVDIDCEQPTRLWDGVWVEYRHY